MSGRCDYQHKYKSILEAAMVSTPDRFTYNSPMSSVPSVPVKQPNAIKSLHHFSETLDIKPKTAVCRLCTAKSNHKEIRTGITLWSSISKRHRHTKINLCLKRDFYNWILQHPQVVQSPRANYCIKLSINIQAEPQLVPQLLLQVSVRDLHNIMVITPEEGGINEERDSEYNIIISD